MMPLPTPLHKEQPSSVEQPALSPSELAEQVLIKGDLSNMSDKQRAHYLVRVCLAVGLNPLPSPFAYIKLNGKLTLYALRAATDQLRKIHGVSVDSSEESELGDIYIVTSKVRDKDGRTDIARGAVSIAGLNGEALANALMKAETKSKRRATLSICGLGLLDETEVEDIPQRKSSNAAKKDGTDKLFNDIRADIQACGDYTTLQEVLDANAQDIANLPDKWAKIIENEKQGKIQDFGGEPEWVEEG